MKFMVGDRVKFVDCLGGAVGAIIDINPAYITYPIEVELEDSSTMVCKEDEILLIEEKENKTMANTREARMELLSNEGQDTKQYIGNTGFTLEELQKMINSGANIIVNGVQINIAEKAKEIEDEYIYNSKLDSRWIPAQMFEMLKYKKPTRWGGCCNPSGYNGYTDYINGRIDYMYQFNFMVDELGRIAKREEEKDATFEIKNLFFNNVVAADVCRAYINKLMNHINRLIAKQSGKHKYLGKEYIRISSRIPRAWKHITESKHFDVYVDKIDIIYNVLLDLCEQIESAETNRETQILLKEFIRKMPVKFKGTGQLHEEFVDAYKGNGAYYTLMNLLRDKDKNCYVWNRDNSTWVYRMSKHNGTHLSRVEGIQLVNEKAKEYANEGCHWKLLGFMKEVIRDNNFDLNTYLGR